MSTRIEVLALGGTIAMMQDADGGRAVPGAGAPGAALGARLGDIVITRHELADLPSPSVHPSDLRRVLLAARSAVDAGAAGVVLTHGTDTLEESAFLLNRLWDREAPLVLTGAMRPATAPGADGPANLVDAVHAAASPLLRGHGALAVMDGEAHLADRVTKVRSRRIGAFTSEPGGPLAVIEGAAPHLLRPPEARSCVLGGDLPAALPVVPVLSLGLGDDAELLSALPPGALAGVVIAGVGVGHVPSRAVEPLTRLVEAGVPVVVSTRVPSGGTARDLYAYPGSEVDLTARGCLMAGRLRPAQARLLLQLLLARGADRAALAAAFAAFDA